MSQHHTVHTVRIPATSAAPPYPVEQAPVTSVVFFPLHLLWDSAESCWEEKLFSVHLYVSVTNYSRFGGA